MALWGQQLLGDQSTWGQALSDSQHEWNQWPEQGKAVFSCRVLDMEGMKGPVWLWAPLRFLPLYPLASVLVGSLNLFAAQDTSASLLMALQPVPPGLPVPTRTRTHHMGKGPCTEMLAPVTFSCT